MRCPVCNRKVIGKLCPVHGNVVGPRRGATQLSVSTNSRVTKAIDDTVTAMSSLVASHVPTNSVMEYWDTEAPSGWEKVADTEHVISGAGLEEDPYIYSILIKYTG